jgi:hypothetical protein
MSRIRGGIISRCQHWSPFLPSHYHVFEYNIEDGKLRGITLYFTLRICSSDWELYMKTIQGFKTPLSWAPNLVYKGKAIITWTPKRPVPWVPRDLYEKIRQMPVPWVPRDLLYVPKKNIMQFIVRSHWSPFLPFHDHIYTEDGKLYRSDLYFKVRIYVDWRFILRAKQGSKTPLSWAPNLVYKGKAIITWTPKRPVPWVPRDLYEKILSSQPK